MSGPELLAWASLATVSLPEHVSTAWPCFPRPAHLTHPHTLFPVSNNYFRYTRVSTVASASAMCCALVGVYWGVVRAEMRIQGSIPNGKNLLPWMRGYKHDFVPRFMKQKSPLRVQATGSTMDAFLEDER